MYTKIDKGCQEESISVSSGDEIHISVASLLRQQQVDIPIIMLITLNSNKFNYLLFEICVPLVEIPRQKEVIDDVAHK